MRPEVGHLKLEPRLDLPVGVFRQTNLTRLANPFEPGRDVHAVAHEVAVRFLDDVAKMNADAKLDATFGRQAGVALDHAGLHLEGAAHGVDHAAELDDRAVAGALDDAAVMGGDGRVDEVAAEAPKTRKRSVFVGPGEPAIADDIRDQNRRELSGLAHCAAGATEAARMPVEARATAGIVAWTETLMVRPTTGQPRAFSNQPKERRLGINT